MKPLLFFIFLLISCITNAQVNIEFEKSNFPNQKEQFKEARRNYEDGKDLFRDGYKVYLDQLEFFVNTHHYMPVSRNDCNHAGEAAFRQALRLLESANRFNPDNADLNWMIAFSKFCVNRQSDESLRYFDKAYKLNPNLVPELAYYAGWANQLLAKWDEAARYYNLYLSYLKTQSKTPSYKLEDVNKKIEECSVGKKLMARPQRVFVDNMGSSVNSSFPDYSAFIAADESALVFTS
ncbi:MAG TPA: hypothetical protein VH396_23060, partial [Chitinophagaceae bacterium]